MLVVWAVRRNGIVEMNGKLHSEWLCFMYDYVHVAPEWEALIVWCADDRAAEYMWMPDSGWLWIEGNLWDVLDSM